MYSVSSSSILRIAEISANVTVNNFVSIDIWVSYFVVLEGEFEDGMDVFEVAVGLFE